MTATHKSLLQREYQRKRRNDGLCGWGGCQVVTGDDRYYCQAHWERISENRKIRRVWRRMAKEAA